MTKQKGRSKEDLEIQTKWQDHKGKQLNLENKKETLKAPQKCERGLLGWKGKGKIKTSRRSNYR